MYMSLSQTLVITVQVSTSSIKIAKSKKVLALAAGREQQVTQQEMPEHQTSFMNRLS